MVVGAHAGDAEIMGGAAILKHVAVGWRAVIMHLTLGEKGSPPLPPDEYAKVKLEEAQLAAQRLGAECVVLPYRDGELAFSEEVQWAIADRMRQYRPDVLLTHWVGSLHRDHRHAHQNVMESLFFAQLKAFQREHPACGPMRIYFAENWEDEDGFKPEVYLDVSDVFDRYLEAIKSYGIFRIGGSSFPYEQWYRGAGEMRGAECRADRAVAFMEPKSYYHRRTVEYLKE